MVFCESCFQFIWIYSKNATNLLHASFRIIMLNLKDIGRGLIFFIENEILSIKIAYICAPKFFGINPILTEFNRILARYTNT